jgi:hypothetical protein
MRAARLFLPVVVKLALVGVAWWRSLAVQAFLPQLASVVQGVLVPDVYSVITEVDDDVVETVGNAMELRAADPQQQRMLADHLARIALPSAAEVLETGRGTGAISRRLAAVADVAHVVGTDPSPGLLRRARAHSSSTSGVSFHEADGRDLPFEDDRFDVVVAHDPLQSCALAFVFGFVNDPCVVRRLPLILEQAGSLNCASAATGTPRSTNRRTC